MSAARQWHQRPGLAVRWTLLFAVLSAHAAVLWFWPIGRPPAELQHITPVRVVMVDEGAAPKPLARAAAEAPPQRSAVVRQVAPGNAPSSPPTPVSTQANDAPMKPPSGESSATSVAVVNAAIATGARVDGMANPTQASSALPVPGISTVAAAPSTAKTMQDLCPHTVKAVPPARATQAGLGGMVLARATIQGGKVRRVEILKSEPGGLYDAAVRTAMAQYICRDQGEREVIAEQLFEFKLVE